LALGVRANSNVLGVSVLPMLFFIAIHGGLLIMLGQHTRSESLFYYFRIEDQVPENHLLRLLDRHISFDFVHQKLKDSYRDTGRPSIDPELLLRILLIGYLYGVTSERKLVEELQMHLAWRWFTGLSFDQEIPHHSTFSKNRHGRFQESNLFQRALNRSWIAAWKPDSSRASTCPSCRGVRQTPQLLSPCIGRSGQNQANVSDL
jgi:transposase